ncbi:N-glycosyltransferase [Sedimentisphaera cyanobacteriorum]|uniref:N-glycosyltransferase n=1 Tax=Sedimentisphaera cyanobacteriorum TaxID=1940790 RepID=A0A1Q2HPT5_9BACT|nr:glycosyltransferase family 2 protein [Sedimentisphaera cyanobacteriorum]AQQ09438.1 N-glycosyltransferase [Sedimentisphaera cyanobacteriorum]
MHIEWYQTVSLLFVITQLCFLEFIRRNNQHNLKRKEKDSLNDFSPNVYLTIPCKGLDTEFEKNISAFFELAYQNYHLSFVVESEQDPAYPVLCRLKEKFEGRTKALSVMISVAGVSENACQKTHNMLHALKFAPEDTEILAFADSDARPLPEWLGSLVHPLKQEKKVGASTGYRWFIPIDGNIPVLFLSILNGKVAQILGKTRFNQAWGGSMAIRKELFYKLELHKIWQTCVSDDLTLSLQVLKAGYRIRYSPLCMVASYEAFTWKRLFDFIYRQLMITRVTSPIVWILGVIAAMFSVFGSWGALIYGLYALANSLPSAYYALGTSLIFFSAMCVRAYWRQKTMQNLLYRYREDIQKYSIYDITLSSIVSLFMIVFLFVSAFGRTITWRGVRYKMISAYRAKRI